MMTTYIGYCRVSTDKQGQSGLGLEAQEATIRGHLRADDKIILPMMVEVESGKRSDRPVLQKALARCRLMGATLLVAKLDRLSRDAAFVRALMAAGVPVEFCNLPTTKGATGTFLLGIMSEVAQLEAGMVSERTTAALAALKSRGVKLGGDRGHRHTADAARRYGAAGGAVMAAKAAVAAEAASDMIEEARRRLGDSASLNAVAKFLNAEGAQTPRGGAWTATAVRRVLARTA